MLQLIVIVLLALLPAFGIVVPELPPGNDLPGIVEGIEPGPVEPSVPAPLFPPGFEIGD